MNITFAVAMMAALASPSATSPKRPVYPAQSVPAETPVTFAIVESFAEAKMTAVLNRDPRGGGVVIAVKRGALTPELVFAVARALQQSGKRFSPTSTHRATVYFTEGARFQALRPDQRAYAEKIIDKMKAAEMRAAVGIGGRHQSVVIPIGQLPS